MTSSDALVRTKTHSAGPVHQMFGLGYSTHDVLHRTWLQNMPLEWQQRYVALKRELGAAHIGVGAVDYKILVGRWTYPDEITRELRRQHGLTHNVANGACGNTHAAGEDCTDACDPDNEHPWVFLDAHGREVHGQEVFVPTADPIPHYRHGDAEPDLSDPWVRVHQAEQVRLLLSIHDLDVEAEPAADAGEWLPNLVLVTPVDDLAAVEAAEWSHTVTRAIGSVARWTIESVDTKLANRHRGPGVLVRLPHLCS